MILRCRKWKSTALLLRILAGDSFVLIKWVIQRDTAVYALRISQGLSRLSHNASRAIINIFSSDHLRDKHLKSLECTKCCRYRCSKLDNFKRHEATCNGNIPPTRDDASYIPVTKEDKELTEYIKKREVSWKQIFKKIFNQEPPPDGEGQNAHFLCVFVS